MNILYKPLAEILLLHEFYVTDSKLASVFDLANQTDRISWLEDNFDPSQPAISSDLVVTPDTPTAAVLRNQHMKLVPTNWGFMVGIRVVATAAGYRPFIPVPAGLQLTFLLQRNNPGLDGVTNNRLSRPLPAAYFFSNQDCPDPKTSPFLCNAVPVYDPAYPYEMGELNLNGATLQQAIATGVAPPMIPVKNGGFISEKDRLLLQLTPWYSFSAADNVTQATFTLTDSNNQVVKTTTVGSNAAGAAPLTKVPLDFTMANPGLPLYTLSVTGSNAYSKQFKIVFHPEAASCWGAIELFPTVNTATFNLLDANDLLVATSPVFEIRIKSRLAYWRYNPNADGVTLAINANNTNYLNANAPGLVTKSPRICTYTPTLFTMDNINYDNLPNPVYGSVLAQTGNQFFKDIWVQKTDMFS